VEPRAVAVAANSLTDLLHFALKVGPFLRYS
jgi:hypothetical protein